MTSIAYNRLMPVDMALWNPRGCLVSVIDELPEARQAAVDLRDAGFDEHEVLLAPAQDIAQIGDSPSNSGMLARIRRGIGSFGDESIVAATFLDEARQGHHLLIVHALRDDLRRRAREVVVRHKAHTVRYYGRWVITDRV